MPHLQLSPCAPWQLIGIAYIVVSQLTSGFAGHTFKGRTKVRAAF